MTFYNGANKPLTINLAIKHLPHKSLAFSIFGSLYLIELSKHGLWVFYDPLLD